MLEFEEYKQKLNADRPKLEVLRSALESGFVEIQKNSVSLCVEL